MKDFNYQRAVDKSFLFVIILLCIGCAYILYKMIDWESFNFYVFSFQVALNFFVLLGFWQFTRLQYILEIKRLEKTILYLTKEYENKGVE
jgi:hypothetical protein